jgi:hypothetical protein
MQKNGYFSKGRSECPGQHPDSSYVYPAFPMKKLSALLLLSCILLSQASFSPESEATQATVITISRSGGGPNGYNAIREEHHDNLHTLSASKPGWDKAAWTILPKLSYCEKTVQEIESDVLKAMETPGAFSGDIAYTRTLVEWKGTKDSYTIIIREE